jgi:hypothetical protein
MVGNKLISEITFSQEALRGCRRPKERCRRTTSLAAFWDIHNPDDTVVIKLKDERCNELIVEVADPKGAVELVMAALPR